MKKILSILLIMISLFSSLYADASTDVTVNVCNDRCANKTHFLWNGHWDAEQNKCVYASIEHCKAGCSSYWARCNPEQEQGEIIYMNESGPGLVVEIEDYDKDGIEDPRDLCILTKGSVNNFGCPIKTDRPAPGGVLFRPGAVTKITGGYGHVAMYAGDFELSSNYKAAVDLDVYRYDEGSEIYRLVQVRKGQRLQVGDLIQDAVLEIMAEGARVVDYTTFKKDSDEWESDLRIDYRERDLSQGQIRVMYSFMEGLIVDTDTGKFNYDLIYKGKKKMFGFIGEERSYFDCVTSVEAAYERVIEGGNVPDSSERWFSAPITPHEYFDYMTNPPKKEEKVVEIRVHSPVELYIDSGERMAGRKADEIESADARSAYMRFEDGAKVLRMRDFDDGVLYVSGTGDGEYTLSVADSFSKKGEVRMLEFETLQADGQMEAELGLGAENPLLVVDGGAGVEPEISFEQIEYLPINQVEEIAEDAEEIGGAGSNQREQIEQAVKELEEQTGCAIAPLLAGALSLNIIMNRKR